MTPEKVRQRLERLNTHELQTFIESAQMLAATTLRSDVPDTEVNLRYALEQAHYVVYGLEELVARKADGEFIRRLE